MPSSTGFTLSLRRLLILLSAIGLLPLALLGLWSLHTASQYQQREQGRPRWPTWNGRCRAMKA